MNRADRVLVEAIKSADKIALTITNNGEKTVLHFQPNKKLHHDIALAYQSAVIEKERQLNRIINGSQN